ncbi:MAG: AMP-binding protein [Weeksellaceae bacterium]|nr:AMP-binding protein [Weeksellaceae bacterium]
MNTQELLILDFRPGKEFYNADIEMLQWQTEILEWVEEFRSEENFLVQTSGSTGKPKKISLSKTAMIQSAKSTAGFLNLPAGTSAWLCLPVQYIAGKMMVVRAMVNQWKLICSRPTTTPIIHENVDFTAMTPMQAENSMQILHHCRKIILGGSPVGEALEEKIKILGLTAFETYGMTETITHIAMRKVCEEKYFKTIPNVQISTDHRDCLVIRANFLDEEVVTNDIVKLVNDNTFEWLGRYDFVINSGGVKLQPEEIEKKLTPHIPIPFLVSSIPDAVLGEKLVLLTEIPLKTEIEWHKTGLEKVQIPKEIICLPDLDKTDNGKWKRREIKSRLAKLFPPG